jgi:hypothetical protein
VALDLAKLRKLLALDPDDALSRFALANGLLTQDGSPAAKAEALEHLRFAHAKDAAHLATCRLLGELLVDAGAHVEARQVLSAGLARMPDVGEGMGRDLGPVMQALLDRLPPQS